VEAATSTEVSGQAATAEQEDGARGKAQVEQPPPGADLSAVLGVASTLAGGIGVLGFVAAVGGSIVFARFSAAGLPADEALGDVPQSSLLVLGAKALIPFAVAVLIGATVVYVVESPETRIGDRISVRDRRWVLVAIAAVAGVSLHVALTLGSHARPPWYTYLTVVVAAAVVSSLVAFGWGEKSFQWFAIASAIAGGLLAETSILIRAFAQPTVRPVAIVRGAGRSPIVGIYIAQSDSQVFVGQVCSDPANPQNGDGGTGYMQVIPRDQVEATAIGTNSTLRTSIERGPGLLKALGAIAPTGPSAGRGSPTSGGGVICTSGIRSGTAGSSSATAQRPSPFGVIRATSSAPHQAH
jgi:hypothetical protein